MFVYPDAPIWVYYISLAIFVVVGVAAGVLEYKRKVSKSRPSFDTMFSKLGRAVFVGFLSGAVSSLCFLVAAVG